MNHTCHAEGCSVPVPPQRLMCLRHWRMVPKRMQYGVWAHYRRGQCDDKRPSVGWCLAADDAVRVVAAKEGRTVRHTFLAAFYPVSA